MTGIRFANVSVDLDGLDCYHRIHGLGEEADPTAIYRVALPRLLELFDELEIAATFFVIAADLEHDEAVAGLRRALAAGHEVASHTYHHPYDLRSWNETRIAAEIALAGRTIHDRVGVRPVGFRTPGYNVDSRILRILSEQGYRYDSSVFPCPSYYLAKGAIMAAMAVAGRHSGSAMTHPAALKAPLQPYRPSRMDFSCPGDREDSLPLWEIPVGVLPLARLPVIGTTVGALKPGAARKLAGAFGFRQPTLQFEMHGIDLMDRGDDAIVPALAARQPDVRRPWRDKREAYAAFLRAMGHGRRFTTLVEAADALTDAAGPTVVGHRMSDFA